VRQQLTFWLAIILGIAVFYAIRSELGGREKAHRGWPTPDIVIANGIKSALDAFKVDNGFYPTNLQDLLQQPSNAKNWHGSYFDPPKLPVDPWGHKFLYEYPGKHNTNGYDLFSAGPDGKPGTDDDIGYWVN
jgi:general secretion pathway protein G